VKRPDGLDVNSTAARIFEKILEKVVNVERSEALFNENLREIDDHLVKTHGFDLAPDDLRGIAEVYKAFYVYGPRIQWTLRGSGGDTQPKYVDLMTAVDLSGMERGYLATEDKFQFMKDLESRNLLIPVVGDFAGTKAIRAVGRYVKGKGATVSAFYLSNVEMLLGPGRSGSWNGFCANVASLPLDDSSTFIRSVRRAGAPRGAGPGFELGRMRAETNGCRD